MISNNKILAKFLFSVNVRRMTRKIPFFFTFLFLCAFLPLRAEFKPVFVVISDGSDFSTKTKLLTQQGARIKQEFPPYALITDIPDSLKIDLIPAVKNHYFGPVPISTLKQYGSMIVAAGLQWNRSLVKSSAFKGQSAMGTMKANVSQSSLEAPTNLSAQLDGRNSHYR